MKAIVTVVGKDRVGIIAGVCVKLAQYNINVLDISQTVMQGYFTMMMAVDTSKSEIPFAELAKKLEAKGFLRRSEPGFLCTPLVSKNQIQKAEAASLVKKIFGGSRKALFSALLEDEPLSEEEIEALRALIDKG